MAFHASSSNRRTAAPSTTWEATVSTPVTLRPDLVSEVAALGGVADVVSVYVDSRPERKMHGRPGWEIPLRRGLSEIGRDPDVRAHLASLESELDELSDPNGPGRGRALFTAVGGPTIGPLWTQGPLPDHVSFGAHPSLGPLIVAVDEVRPAGIALVGGSHVRVVECRGVDAEDIAGFEFDDQSSEWREFRGPAGPARAYESASQSDLFARRQEAHRALWLAGLADTLIQLAAQRGWDETLVLAEAKTAAALAERDPSLHRVVASHGIHTGSATHVAGQLQAGLDGRRQRVRAKLVQGAIDAALSGGRGALGWHDVATVLAEGRVESLLVDPAAATGSRPADAATLDELIVRAIGTDAKVVPIHGGAAGALAPHGGLGAILRW
jgi:hypothetical protein